MKRLALFICTLLCANMLLAQTEFIVGNLTYRVDSSNPTEVSVGTVDYTITTANIPATVSYNGTTYSVTSIRLQGFYDCDSLTSITIPNSVTIISERAFESCSSLTSVTIPNSVTSIGSSAFYNCDGLTSITIPNSVTSIGGYTFYSCSSLTSVTIGNSVTSIGDYEFAYCSSLTSIDIPNSVTSIGDYAFIGCTSLTTLNFNAINCNSFSSYKHPFINCPITTINIGDSVQIIPAYFAYNLDALTSVTIGNSVTSIGNGAFGNCSSLTSVTIGNSVTSIGNGAFGNCSSLTSITIPNSVTSIGNSAFYGCNGLSILNFNAINCGDFTTSNYPFADCPFIVINIGDSVERIPDYFAFDKNLLTSISVPNSVTEIGNNAFDSCSALTSVILGDGLSTLPANAFANCNDILYITLGSGFASLPANAFSHCLLLQGVTSNAVVPPLCSSTVFPYPNTATLTVPCGSLEAYSAQTSIWSILFADRIEEDGYEVVANVNNDAFGSVAIENNCSTATLTATANACYQFVGWNDGNTENPRLVTLSSDTTLTANFEVMVFDTTITATINAGEMYSEFGFNESEAGTYVQNLQTVNGCDSTITLILDVNSSLMDVEHSELSFYPNPTDSKVNFSQAIEKVEVIDLTGKTIFTFSNAKTINIESLPAGAYYLRLTNDEKTIMQKVIKQ